MNEMNEKERERDTYSVAEFLKLRNLFADALNVDSNGRAIY